MTMLTPEEDYQALLDELIEVKLVIVKLKKDRDKWKEAAHSQDKLVLRLREHISDFRRLCDPYELKVMVTPDELSAP